MAASSCISGSRSAVLLRCFVWTSVAGLPGATAVVFSAEKSSAQPPASASSHGSLMRKSEIALQKSQVKLSAHKDERLTMTEFGRKGCVGDPQNEYTFYPSGENEAADFVEHDCVTVKSNGVNAGHFGISCHPETGEALINKYVKVGMKDWTCHESEPILLKIIHADARNLFSGECVQAEMPDAEGFSEPLYLRFGHIDPRVTWPTCSSFTERSKHNVLVIVLAVIIPLFCCCCVGGAVLAYFNWSALELYAQKLGYPLRRKIDSRNIYGYGEGGGEDVHVYDESGEGAGEGAAEVEQRSNEQVQSS